MVIMHFYPKTNHHKKKLLWWFILFFRLFVEGKYVIYESPDLLNMTDENI